MRLTKFQKEIVKENLNSWMSIEYIVNIIWYKFPWEKRYLKQAIKNYEKELKKTLQNNKSKKN